MNGNPLATLVAILALALGTFALATAYNKRACECPRPQLHDDRDDDRRDPPRRRRPDGSTGATGAVDCPDGKCLPKDATGVVKRDM